MHMTGLYERSQTLSATDDAARAASAEFAYCDLLLGGVTSSVDISSPWAGWVELFAKSGLRGFLAPGYASARWYLKDDHELPLCLGRGARPCRVCRGARADRHRARASLRQTL